MTGKYFIYFKIMIIKRIRSENLNFEKFSELCFKNMIGIVLYGVCV